MSYQIKASTTITVDSGVDNHILYAQSYSYAEEALNSVSRIVKPNTVEELVVIPDTDIQSSAKFVLISATGSVSNLAAARVAMEVRKYAAPKNTVVAPAQCTFNGKTTVYGALSGERVEGDKNLSSMISLKGGAIGAMLFKDSDGVVTDYDKNNAFPLTLKVDNKGTEAITVFIKAMYDPTPADHTGKA